MRAYTRPKNLGAHLSLRLTEDEAKRVAAQAARASQTVSEWARQAVLDALDCPPWARLMLGEFLALRSVLVDLQRDLMQGVTPTNERIKAILETADTRKLALADGRLAKLAPPKEPAQ